MFKECLAQLIVLRHFGFWTWLAVCDMRKIGTVNSAWDANICYCYYYSLPKLSDGAGLPTRWAVVGATGKQ